MSKLLACQRCLDVVMLKPFPAHAEKPRTCACGLSQGFFLGDNHHALLVGPAIALGIWNPDLAEAFRDASQNEAGYWPVRVWRIPDGDRIIVLNREGAVVAPCTRCQPFCRWNDFAKHDVKVTFPDAVQQAITRELVDPVGVCGALPGKTGTALDLNMPEPCPLSRGHAGEHDWSRGFLGDPKI